MFDFFTENWKEGTLVHKLFIGSLVTTVVCIVGFIFTLFLYIWLPDVEELHNLLDNALKSFGLFGVPSLFVMFGSAMSIDDNNDFKHHAYKSRRRYY